MDLVDAHSHLGNCRVFDANQTSAQLVDAMDGAGVTTAVVQPFPGAPNAADAHNAIAALASQYPGRIVGMASVSPHQDPDAYRAELRRCVSRLGFAAVKLHPVGHAVRPNSIAAKLVFRTASELGIVVMIHTGAGVPFAEPASWIPLAREFPDTPVILAHAGAGIYAHPALVAAQMCPNVVLETSWSNPQDIRLAIQTVGAERVLFGSDMVFNLPVELSKYNTLDLSHDQRRLVFGANARRVYGLGSTATG